jgi:hypothetical protein
MSSNVPPVTEALIVDQQRLNISSTDVYGGLVPTEAVKQSLSRHVQSVLRQYNMLDPGRWRTKVKFVCM